MNTLNFVDYGLIAVFVFSMLIGLRRGLVKEVVSVVTWVAALFVAVQFAAPLSASFSGVTHSIQASLSNVVTAVGANVSTEGAASMLAVGISFFILFVGTLILGSIVGGILSSAAELPGINLVNSICGAGFGFARGFLFNLVLIFLVQLTSFGQESLWTQSMITNAYQPAVAWLGDAIQPGIQNLKSRLGQVFN